MADDPSYPYVTRLDIQFDPLTLIDVDQLAKSVTDQWFNQTLCRVNDSVVRLGVMKGEYHWHKHDRDDEFFFVLSGRFVIDLEGRSIELLPGQGFVVPKGVMHCTPRARTQHDPDGRDRGDCADRRRLSCRRRQGGFAFETAAETPGHGRIRQSTATGWPRCH